ncbi:SURF1 family protein, partial [Roseateles sp. GG27B]
WLDDKTVFLENRPMQGRVGFFVVTPLQVEGRREALMVQRGWVPRDGLDRSRLPELPQSTGVVEVEGRLAASASRLYEFSSVFSGRIRQNIDVIEYSKEIKQVLLPLTLLQSRPDSSKSTDGLLRDWAAPATGMDKNYGYAFQWFALCALILGLYVWFQTIRPRRRTRLQ